MTPADVADAAYAQVIASSPRTAARRAAVLLYTAASVPPAKSIDAIRDAIGTFGADTTRRDALSLLDRLTALAEQETTA